MTRPGIEPRSPGPLANTLTPRPMSGINYIHTDAIINDERRFFRKIYTSRFICDVCVWEGVRDRTELQYFDPHSYGRQHCVFLVLQGCLTGGPEAHSAGWWLSLQHLIGSFSGSQLNRWPQAPSAWPGVAFPTTLVYNSVSSCNSNWSLTVLTELYNGSTPI